MSFVSNICFPFAKSPFEGAQTQIMLAVDPSLDEISGKYFSDCAEVQPSKEAISDDNAKWLWVKSSELVGF